MLARFTIAAAALVIADPAASQAPDIVRVAFETSRGRIVVAVDRGRAPVTAGNFLRYVDARRYDGETVYRVLPYGDGGLVQGGIRSDARKLWPGIAHEPTSQTGLRHTAGTVSMARLAPGTAQADFFILTTAIPAFDASSADPGFAAFGSVVEGMDVVQAILSSPTSPTKGADVGMQGQLLDEPVKIDRASRMAD